MTTCMERIAAAIVEVYPGERCIVDLAEQLYIAAALDGVPSQAVLAWLHDLPRHELSVAAFRAWCDRYGIRRTRQGVLLDLPPIDTTYPD